MDDLKHKVFTIILCCLIMIIVICFGMKFIIKLSNEEYKDPNEEVSKEQEMQTPSETDQKKQVKIKNSENNQNQTPQDYYNAQNNYNSKNKDNRQNPQDDYLLQGTPYYDIPEKTIQNEENDVEFKNLIDDDKIRETSQSNEATRYNKVMEEARRYSEFISENYE